MKKCYFLCSFTSNLSYKQSKFICENKLVGVSSSQEAVFLDFMIFSEIFKNKTIRNHLKNVRKKLRTINIPIGKFKFRNLFFF